MDTQNQTSSQNAANTLENANQANSVAPTTIPTKRVPFSFRPVKKSDATKFANALSLFQSHNLPFEPVMESQKVNGVDTEVEIGIKRATIQVDVPIFTADQFPADFLAELLEAATIDAVRKKYIDNGLPVDYENFGVNDVVEVASSKREAAVDKAIITACEAFVIGKLTTSGRPASTISVISDMIKNKFNLRCLQSYQNFKDKFHDILAVIISCYQNEQKEPIAEFYQHEPALSLFSKNIEKFFATEESATKELALDLL